MKYRIEFAIFNKCNGYKGIKTSASIQIETEDFEAADMLAAAIAKSSQFDDYNVYELF